MARYIDGEHVKEILNEDVDEVDTSIREHESFFVNGLKRAIYVIDKEPTADVQPINQWISVKDRLPDENQKCLVYRDIDDDLKITTGIWHSEWKAFDGLRHGTRLEDAIAWMPLPEPPMDGDAK